jgi:hypothetical protein
MDNGQYSRAAFVFENLNDDAEVERIDRSWDEGPYCHGCGGLLVDGRCVGNCAGDGEEEVEF